MAFLGRVALLSSTEVPITWTTTVHAIMAVTQPTLFIEAIVWHRAFSQISFCLLRFCAGEKLAQLA